MYKYVSSKTLSTTWNKENIIFKVRQIMLYEKKLGENKTSNDE